MKRKEIAKEVVYQRNLKFLTQQQLAERSGLSRTSISLIECGLRNPSVETLLKICKGLDMKPEEFLAGIKGINCSTGIDGDIDELFLKIKASPDYVKRNVICYFYHNTTNCKDCPYKLGCNDFKIYHGESK